MNGCNYVTVFMSVVFKVLLYIYTFVLYTLHFCTFFEPKYDSLIWKHRNIIILLLL